MDGSGGPLIGPIIFGVLLLADFVLSVFGAALQAVTENSLEQSGAQDEKTEKLLKLKADPENLIYACWLYHIMACSLGVIFLLWGIDAKPHSSPFWGGVRGWLALLLSMIAIYIFGKALPRLVGRKYAPVWCRRLCFTACGLVTVSLPFTYVLTVIVHLIARLFGIGSHTPEDEVTEDEIISMVNEGHEQGVLDEHEAEMIQNIFEMDDKEAQDIMTHRKNIIGVDGRLNLNQAISFMLEEANSRFPVYEDNIDNIIGVIHLKDAMIFHLKNQYDNWLIKDIPDLLRPVKFIPETRGINVLFRSMQAQKLQMVIVVDEYGETAGLVTMEDILEEIVGNILDEYDEDELFILRQEDGSYRIDGMAPLKDVEATLDISFGEEDYETLSGYLVYRLDHIPEEDEHTVIEEDGYSFRIMEVENKTIKWVEVTRLLQEENAPANSTDNEKEITAERE